MHGAVATALAAAVVAASAYGLLAIDSRAGPLDLQLQPVAANVEVTGTSEARPDTRVAGLCLEPPCDPLTALDLRMEGLPEGPYQVRLQGDGELAIGPLVATGGAHVLRWSEAADHRDKGLLVLSLGGHDLAALELPQGEGPREVAAVLSLDWGPGATARLQEIGGFTVSTLVELRLDEATPGWERHAYLEGGAGRVDLGRLHDGRLDARLERVGIEHQDRLVVAWVVEGHEVPVLAAPIRA